MASPPAAFPDPSRAPADGPLALGGDLSVGTLLSAYRQGIFPWPLDEDLLSWWCPDPRAVLPLDGLHISRSLARTLRRGALSTTADRDFAGVLDGCADRDVTWITPWLAHAYRRLHAAGHAHSIEVHDEDGALVGGLYGVAIGAAFSAESMFHRVDDASKVALVGLVERLRRGGFTLLDVQLPTRHLASLGAVAVPRRAFLTRLAEARERTATWSGAT